MAAGPGVLRVSVVGGHDRVDLVVPAAVRVAELLPELPVPGAPGDPLAAPREVWLSVLGGARLDPAGRARRSGRRRRRRAHVTCAADHVGPGRSPTTSRSSWPRWSRPSRTRARPRWLGGPRGLDRAARTRGGGRDRPRARHWPPPPSAVISACSCHGPRPRWPAATAPLRCRPGAAWLAVGHAGAAGCGRWSHGVPELGWVVVGAVAALASRRQCGSALWAAPVAGVVLVAADLTARLTSASLPTRSRSPARWCSWS